MVYSNILAINIKEQKYFNIYFKKEKIWMDYIFIS